MNLQFPPVIKCMLMVLISVFVCIPFPVDELISPKDIDPIHRYVPRQDQRNVSMRYSNQVRCNVTTPTVTSRLQ